MGISDLILKDKTLRAEESIKNALICEEVVSKYLESKYNDGILYSRTQDSINDLLTAYFLSKGTENHLLLEKIMQDYNFNYSATIRNAITIMFGRDSELSGRKSNPVDWPGMVSVVHEDNICRLDTTLGMVSIAKASPLFIKDDVHCVFYNHLVSECFIRSYEFAAFKKDDCRVVLSYLPNLFYSGHYHAYLELNDSVLDIAANCLYFSMEDSNKILNGRIVKKMSYGEIEEEYSDLKRRYPDLSDKYNKLYVLALYNDSKNRF